MRWATIVLTGCLFGWSASSPISGQAVDFVRGDLTQDQLTSLSDFSYLVSYLFSDGGAPACLDAADVNDDGAIDLADVTTLLAFLTNASPSLPAPFDALGVDPTPDALDCLQGPDGEPQGSEIDHIYFSFSGTGGTGPALSPGQSPAIFDIRLDTTISLRGYSLVVEYDPEILTSAEFLFGRGVAPEHGAEIQYSSIGTDGVVVAHVLVDAFLPSGTGAFPPGASLLLAQIQFEVAPTAPVDTVTTLTFRTVPDGPNAVSELVTTDHLTLLPVVAAVELPIVAPSELFLRGDASGDGKVDLADAVLLLEELLAQSSVPQCAQARDVDDTGAVDLADPIRLLAFLFAGGETLPPPYPHLGVDPSPNTVDCD